MMWNNISVVIPARVESSRVNRKVFQKIKYFGQELPLIEIKVLELLKVFPRENIIISAGEEPLKKIALKYGVAYSVRGKEFYERGYTTTTEESVREVLKDVRTPYVAWCPPVVPFHSSDVIKIALESFFQGGCVGSLTTAVSMKSYFWWQGNALNYFADSRHVQSQLLEPLHRIANGLYVGKTEELRIAGYFLVEPIKLFEVNEIQALDIDTPEDLLLAQTLSSSYYEI